MFTISKNQLVAEVLYRDRRVIVEIFSQDERFRKANSAIIGVERIAAQIYLQGLISSDQEAMLAEFFHTRGWKILYS